MIAHLCEPALMVYPSVVHPGTVGRHQDRGSSSTSSGFSLLMWERKRIVHGFSEVSTKGGSLEMTTQSVPATTVRVVPNPSGGIRQYNVALAVPEATHRNR